MKLVTLREARQRRKMTQDELAARAGVDQTTISSLETGRHTNPTLDTIEKLARALGIAPARLTFTDLEAVTTVDPVDDSVGQGRVAS